MESLEHKSPSTVDKLSTFCKEIIFKCDGKVTEENHIKSIDSLAAYLTTKLNEGIRAIHMAIKN